MKPILVTSYVGPDLDGSACAVAYAEFLNKVGKRAVAGIIGGLHIEAKFAFEKSGVRMPLRLKNAHGFEHVVLVDTSNLSMFEGKLKPERVIEIIDHRDVHEAESFPNAKIQIERVGAAATLIAERFMTIRTTNKIRKYENSTKNKVVISKESALLLYGAIASNTLNFKAIRTTERDKKAFSWLEERAEVDKDFVHKMFLAKSDLGGARLKEALWSDYSWYTFGGKTVAIAQLEVIGGHELVENRQDEILSELRSIKRERSAHLVFLNIIELEKNGNIFVAEETEMQVLLSELFKVSFFKGIAWHQGLLMRKDIVLTFKRYFEI